MALDWSGLGEVAVVSVGATVGVVLVFALGVRLLSRRHEPGGTSPGGAGPGGAGRRASVLARTVAGLCFLTCAAAVAYGLYLIVPQFH
ncbi:hypothetical protein ACWGDX_20995 [Streptomyces sp. NPDC055025]